MLEDELELICWRANAQCWDAAEHHMVSWLKTASTCVCMTSYHFQSRYPIIQFIFKPLASSPISNNHSIMPNDRWLQENTAYLMSLLISHCLCLQTHRTFVEQFLLIFKWMIFCLPLKTCRIIKVEMSVHYLSAEYGRDFGHSSMWQYPFCQYSGAADLVRRVLQCSWAGRDRWRSWLHPDRWLH